MPKKKRRKPAPHDDSDRDGEDSEVLTGREAIEYARDRGCLLRKYNDPIEDARDDLTADQAEDVARQDPSLIYLLVPGAGGAVGREA